MWAPARRCGIHFARQGEKAALRTGFERIAFADHFSIQRHVRLFSSPATKNLTTNKDIHASGDRSIATTTSKLALSPTAAVEQHSPTAAVELHSPTAAVEQHSPTAAVDSQPTEAADASSTSNGKTTPPIVDGMPRWPEFTTSNGVLRCLDWTCTCFFAASGSITAATCGMDLLGCTIIGTVTAIGGGTFRDAIVLHKQPFWIEEWEYFLMAAGVAAGTFLYWRDLPADFPKFMPLKTQDGGEGKLMLWGDAFGIGTFCVIGAMNGIRMGCHNSISTCCGMMTATFGGLTRDIVCRRPPRILHSESDIYATCALAGAAVYIGLRAVAPYQLGLRIAAGFSTAVLLRYLAWEHGLRLPTWTKSPPIQTWTPRNPE